MQKISDIAAYSRHHCYHPLEKEPIPSLFWGQDTTTTGQLKPTDRPELYGFFSLSFIQDYVN